MSTPVPRRHECTLPCSSHPRTTRSTHPSPVVARYPGSISAVMHRCSFAGLRIRRPPSASQFFPCKHWARSPSAHVPCRSFARPARQPLLWSASSAFIISTSLRKYPPKKTKFMSLRCALSSSNSSTLLLFPSMKSNTFRTLSRWFPVSYEILSQGSRGARIVKTKRTICVMEVHLWNLLPLYHSAHQKHRKNPHQYSRYSFRRTAIPPSFSYPSPAGAVQSFDAKQQGCRGN
mmetsp:Transcript_46729/g.109995  ORF Transcript_46729/g.109995 Transcript_46729/m.109995 type:complete len:233 (+) Transcript_46729:1844-2542(+)